MSENEVTGLPHGWAKARISQLVAPDGIFVDGDWVESKDQDPVGNVRLIQLADVGDGTYRNRSSRFLTESKAYELRCTFLKAGDVLIARMPDPLGRACIFPGDPKKSVTAVDVCIARTGTNGANHRWLMWTINSPDFRSQVAALQSGSTRKRISRSNLATIEIPVPPLSEQHRIVAEIEKQFTRLDAGVAALERARANLKRYRASVLKAACEGRLVPTEAESARAEGREYEPADRLLARILKERRAKWEADQLAKMQAQGKVPEDNKWKERYQEPAGPDTTDLPELLEGWGWTCLGQMTELITSGSRNWAEHYAVSGPLFIRAQDIKRDRLEPGSVIHVELPAGVEGTRTRVRQSDLLVTITGANVTKTALVREKLPEAYVSQHVGLVRPVLPDYALYLYHWVVSPSHGRRILLREAYGAGKPGLNLENLRELIVALPPLAEQYRIVAEAERRLSVIDELEAVVVANLKRAERLRQSILKRAFEGKLVPQDPHDEPASVLLECIRTERAGREMVGATDRSPLQTGNKKRNSRVSDTQAELFR